MYRKKLLLLRKICDMKFRFNHFIWAFTCYMVAMFAISQPLFAQGDKLSDERVKAIYLFNFPKYIDWQGDANDADEFKIAVYGNNPNLLNELRDVCKRGYSDGTTIIVLNFKKISDITPVQILYVCKDRNSELKAVYDKCKGKNILFVTDCSESKKNTMINFLPPDKNGKILFEVNKTNASDEKIKISSKIMTEGAEIIMQELYKESENDLKNQTELVKKQIQEIETQKQNIRDQNEKINNQKIEISKQRDEMQRQQTEIDLQQSKITLQKEELAKILHQVDTLQKNVEEKMKTLKKQESDIKLQLVKVNKLQAQEISQREILKHQKEEIESQQGKIDFQKQVLDIQVSKIQKQRYILYLASVFIILIGGLAFFIFRSYRIKREANLALQKKNTEIQLQKEEIEHQSHQIGEQRDMLQFQNENIRASIRYAKTIQQAILPMPEAIDKHFEWFVIYRPKDIVSGDFYWFSHFEKENKTFIAVVDCTGHGVPGAFMSMIGNRLLSEIVNEKRIFDPAQILEKLSESVQLALMQDRTNNNDGMDVCLCCIDYLDSERRHITFAGAKRSLYFYTQKNKELSSIKGDIKAIGGRSRLRQVAELPFTNYHIDLKTNDILYLMSDGLIDQSSIDRKRFGQDKFTEAVLGIVNKSMHEQKIAIETALELHQGKSEQRDDITMLGIKL